MQKKRRRGRTSTKTSVEDEIAHLRGLDLGGLRARWQSVFQRSAPAHLTRRLLFAVIAYRLQADRFGDLDHETTQVRLDGLRQHVSEYPNSCWRILRRSGRATKTASSVRADRMAGTRGGQTAVAGCSVRWRGQHQDPTGSPRSQRQAPAAGVGCVFRVRPPLAPPVFARNACTASAGARSLRQPAVPLRSGETPIFPAGVQPLHLHFKEKGAEAPKRLPAAPAANADYVWYRTIAPVLGFGTKHLFSDRILTHQESVLREQAGFAAVALFPRHSFPKVTCPPLCATAHHA